MADARLGTGFINVNKIKSVHSEIKFMVLVLKNFVPFSVLTIKLLNSKYISERT